MVFRKLGVSEEILKAIVELNFIEPSEIQEKAIPLVLAGKDVIGGSATGSGKTLVFASAIIQRTEKGKGIQSLVLTPTRELAEQITKTLRHFSKYKLLNIISVYGGVSIEPQISLLERADVVIGTPGRILDHLNRNTISLNKVKILVLDEADRMLDMGFIDDVDSIIKNVNKNRQTLLFSATISHDINYLAGRYMNNPVKVSAEEFVDPSKLKQFYYDVTFDKKFSLLVHLLKNETSKLVMVFCNTRKTADFVGKTLNKNNIEATAIHGGLTQNRRSNIMENFHKGKCFVLVCTDVAARGLDIKNISHVYNYDIPKTEKEYIHRIGRTARAGKDGKAISLLSQKDYENFKEIHKYHSEIQEEKLPEISMIYLRPFQRKRENRSWKFRGRFDRRGMGNRRDNMPRQSFFKRRRFP